MDIERRYDEEIIASVFTLVADIIDPERGVPLSTLNVVSEERVLLKRLPNGMKQITVVIKPTVPKCSFASELGLMIWMKLAQVPNKEKLKFKLAFEPGSHELELELTRKLNDKERVASALEDENVINTLQRFVNSE